MNQTHLYELAYAFRKSKIWKQVFEDEVFAVKLPKKAAGGKTAYCSIMGSNNEYIALAVYIGPEGFNSYRIIADTSSSMNTPDSYADLLSQDCIQCSLEARDLMDPEELDALRAYTEAAGIPFRAPFPRFSRYFPYCMPWAVRKASDLHALEAVLEVVTRLPAELKKSGKAGLGLWPINVTLHDEAYVVKQLGLFDDTVGDEVTVPLFTIKDGNLVITRIPLPPYTERQPSAPTMINDIAIAKMLRNKQKGVYECEVVRLPEPVDGKPPYIPAALMTVRGDGTVLQPVVGADPVYDANEMLRDFLSVLGDIYPKTIKVRTTETKVLLEEFCRRAKIRLVETEELPLMDDFIDELNDSYLSSSEQPLAEELFHIIDTLDSMTVEEIRTIPAALLDRALEFEDLLPPEILSKIRKARRS